MEHLAAWLVDIVQSFGYLGIFIATFGGNVLVPIPLEVIMIPAGYLAEQGEMKFALVLGVSILGDVCGSIAGYYIAYHFGRRFLYAYGKYLFFTHERMEMLDRFFASHGEISIVTGRLTPGLRHFMAFPAGMAHMNIKKFALYTGVGGGMWSAALLFVGYIIGGNKELIKRYMPYLTIAVITVVTIMISVYVWHQRRKPKGDSNGLA